MVFGFCYLEVYNLERVLILYLVNSAETEEGYRETMKTTSADQLALESVGSSYGNQTNNR